MAVRLFLAINPDAETRRSIAEATDSLREAAPDLRWTDPTRVHLTLKFFGEQDESAVSTLSALADDVAGRLRRFAIRFSQVGAFPNFRRARVVWLGIEHEARLELLHHDVEVACERQGFELEGRPFRPHLTLARVPEGTDPDVLRRLSRAARTVQLDEECVVESIDLMRSRLGPGGASHERLHAAPLVP